MGYEINQIVEFTEDYPEGLYDFVISNNCALLELDRVGDTRRVQIIEIAPETPEERRQRLDQMSLTKREVFLALYKDKGITPEQIKAQITNQEALIEFEYAGDYFRGNPLINQIGQMLGYTSEQLDYLFENKKLPEV